MRFIKKIIFMLVFFGSLQTVILFPSQEVLVYLLDNSKPDLSIDKLNAIVSDFLLLSPRNKTSNVTFMNNYRDENGDTLFIRAAKNDKINIMNFMIVVGVDINGKNLKGLSALSTALIWDNHKMVAFLIAHNASILPSDRAMICGPFLSWLIEHDKLDSIEKLDRAGIIDCNKQHGDGSTLLHLAVKYQAVEIFKYLVQKKHVDLNQQILISTSMSLKNGFTALHCAAVQKSPEMVELLINSGADLEIKDEAGKTVYDYLDSSEFIKNDRRKQSDEINQTRLKVTEELKDRFKNEDDFKQAHAVLFKVEVDENEEDIDFTAQNNSIDSIYFPMLEEGFNLLGLDFKKFLKEKLTDKDWQATTFRGNSNNTTLFDSVIMQAEQIIVQELLKKETKSSLYHTLNSVITSDQNVNIIQDKIFDYIKNYQHYSAMNKVLSECICYQSNNHTSILEKALAMPNSSKKFDLLKFLLVDTQLIHTEPVLYISEDLETLRFLVDHGATNRLPSYSKNYAAFVGIGVPVESNIVLEKKTQLRAITNSTVKYKSIARLGFPSLFLEQKADKKIVQDMMIIEAKKLHAPKMESYVNHRLEEESRAESKAKFAAGGTIATGIGVIALGAGLAAHYYYKNK